MKTPEQFAREAWAYATAGNVAVPGNADAAIKELAPYFAAAQREVIEAAARVAERYGTFEGREIAVNIRALARPPAKGGE